MSSDVIIIEEELSDVLGQIRGQLAVFSSSQGNRMEKYEALQSLMKKANSIFHDFQTEVRLLDGQNQRVYENKCKEYLQTIEEFKAGMSQKRTELYSSDAAKGAVGKGSSSSSSSAFGAVGTPATTSPSTAGGLNKANNSGLGFGGGLFNNNINRNDGKDQARSTAGRIANIQNTTINVLTDVERMIESTETTAQDATKQLQQQTDQMRKINEELNVLDSEVDRAKRELNAFIRRLMTDKILLCFALLIVIAIIVFIIFKFVFKPKSGSPPPTVITSTTAKSFASFSAPPSTSFVSAENYVNYSDNSNSVNTVHSSWLSSVLNLF